MVLAETELSVYRRGIAADRRVDGRTRLQRRTSGALQTGVVAQAAGSAMFALDRTAVLTAIYAKLGRPAYDAPTHGSVTVNVDL